jgi:anaerobic selenocysteine-containing dehydrogenase
VDRREFIKLAGTASIASFAVTDLLSKITPKAHADLTSTTKYENYKIGQKIPSICPYCAGGCGLIVTTLNGSVVEVEGDPSHPINRGAACSKAAAAYQLYTSDQRIKYPMKRTNPNKGKDVDPGWQQITWAEAYAIIANKVKDALTGVPHKHGIDYYYNGKDNPIAWLGSSYWNNEECYLGRKLISLLGSNNVEHQARKCHASTVAALGSTFGFGAMTNHIIDAKNSKCFLIMSNPTESHTMEFKWVTEAIENGATIIVLDPRFTRTAAKAHIYARYRSGSEAAIFLGLIRYVLYEKPDRIDETFLATRTNVPYQTDGTGPLADWQTNPDSVFGKLKALVDPYTPEEVERVSGLSQATLVQVADTFSSLKPGNIYYSMGTTQHSNATQAIRAHAILQLILGNMGKPGGGVNALRGISNVQGSTDMNLLSHLIMGYRAPPTNVTELRRYQQWKNTAPDTRGGVSGGTTYPWPSLDDAKTAGKVTEYQYDARHFPTWNALEYHWGLYVGTWPGVDPDNEPVVCDLPTVKGNPIVQLFRAIKDGLIKVLICNGENPAVSVANVNLVRDALSATHLFTVVYEIFETETAAYADILLPGTVQIERSGSITNTGRWIQWRWKAVDPAYECKPELIYLTELYQHIRSTLKTAGIKLPSEHYEEENAVQINRMIGSQVIENDPEATWPSSFLPQSLDDTLNSEDLAEAVFKETAAKSISVGGVSLPQAAANVLYKNGYDPDNPLYTDIGGILPKRRDPTPLDVEDETYGYYKNWAFSWMLNQRVLYNNLESNPGVNTFFVWFAMAPDTWLGLDKAAIWSKALYNPAKPVTNPFYHGMPLHNEPVESPDATLAAEYPTMWDDRFPVEKGDADDYPYVLTTNRLAEHMQAGAMTRNLPWLVETHPEMFVEISRELATSLDITDGGLVKVKTARTPAGITVKAIVTPRLKPMTVNGNTIHHIAMPWHWGFKGLSTGPSANELTIDSVDVSAEIPETKTCLCNIEKA